MTNEIYTAQEMREAADFFVRNAERVRQKVLSNAILANIHESIPMLRYAAEVVEEIAELRECLREAVREKCPFTRMSCKHGEPCDYECGTKKWRKALEGEK